MKRRVLIVISMLFCLTVFAQDISDTSKIDFSILSEDLIVEMAEVDGQKGYDVFIRKKAGINSVMLLETSKDPEGKRDNYAYRSTQYNSVNGDEIRYLNGKVLVSEYSKYSLLSSTVIERDDLGSCFRIFVPLTIVYGYEWTRNGIVNVKKGTFINIRTFEKPYADYTGGYSDNPFMFDIATIEEEETIEVAEPEVIEPIIEKPVVLTDDYNVDAAQKFNELAERGNGILRYSKPEQLTSDLLDSIAALDPEEYADVVFAIDTTGSMNDDMEALKTEWVPKLLEQLKDFKDIRLGLLFYRDYKDNYNYKGLPVSIMDFTYQTETFIKTLNSVKIRGKEGGDIPEAVYEALYASMEYYDWREEAQKKIILIGDAEPHPKPRGTKKIGQDTVISLANEKNIILDCIIVPDDKSKR